jgi:aryl carrier-like protein
MTEALRLPSGGFRRQSPFRRAQTERSRAEYLRGLLIAAVARLLGTEQALVDPYRPLIELGVSSREAMALVGELQEHLGRQIDPMTIWRAPTITALSERLARQQPAVPSAGLPAVTPAVAPSAEPTGASAAHQVTEPAHVTVAARDVPEEDSEDPVAVVGLGCRLPGGVNGPEVSGSS